jgi:hypothetical protein
LVRFSLRRFSSSICTRPPTQLPAGLWLSITLPYLSTQWGREFIRRGIG